MIKRIEVGNLNGVLYAILAIMFGPPIVLTSLGFFTWSKFKKTAKVYFIMAGVYLVIGLGFCGAILIQ